MFPVFTFATAPSLATVFLGFVLLIMASENPGTGTVTNSLGCS